LKRQGDLLSVKLVISLPDDALVPGELELIEAQLAGLIDQVLPAQDSDNNGKDLSWP